ncbi:MAG: GreA/GreB family elongation factor [bacterium]
MNKASKYGLNTIRNQLEAEKVRLVAIRESKALAAGDQDSWHDEQFKTEMQEETKSLDSIGHLEQLLDSLKEHQPDGNDVVDIGHYVTLSFPEKGEKTFWVDGVVVSGLAHDTVTVESPIGKVIIGSRRGQTATYVVGTSSVQLQVVDIFLPEDLPPL